MATRLRNYRGARGKSNACGGDVSPIWEATPHNGNLQRIRKPDSRGPESHRLQAIGRMSINVSLVNTLAKDRPPDANNGCTFCNSDTVIVSHTHREVFP